MQILRDLCEGVLNGHIKMVPDRAGGATFGLILHYMAAASDSSDDREFAISYLKTLQKKYRARRAPLIFPSHAVLQILGDASFEDALDGATGQRSLEGAMEVGRSDALALSHLGVALFHDGVVFRSHGEERSCQGRMVQVYNLGFRTEFIRWQLARYEVQRLQTLRR